MSGHTGIASAGEYAGLGTKGQSAAPSAAPSVQQPTSMGTPTGLVPPKPVDTQSYWQRPEMSQHQEAMGWIDKSYPRPEEGKSYTPQQLRYGRSDASQYKLPQAYIDQRFPEPAPVQAQPQQYDEAAARRRMGASGIMVGG